MSKSAVIGVLIALVILVGGGVLLAKNSSNNNKSNKASSNTTSSTMKDMNTSSNSSYSSNSSSSPSTTNSVTIEDFAFSPANITVKKGTTVTWTNKDSVAHDVVETDGKTGPNSGTLDSGKTYSFTFDTAGNFSYKCSIHPSMTGMVTVTE